MQQTWVVPSGIKPHELGDPSIEGGPRRLLGGGCIEQQFRNLPEMKIQAVYATMMFNGRGDDEIGEW